MAVHLLPVDGETVSDLQDRFWGELLVSKNESYDDARTIWNAMIDSYWFAWGDLGFREQLGVIGHPLT
jgi:hypothetical protein